MLLVISGSPFVLVYRSLHFTSTEEIFFLLQRKEEGWREKFLLSSLLLLLQFQSSKDKIKRGKRRMNNKEQKHSCYIREQGFTKGIKNQKKKRKESPCTFENKTEKNSKNNGRNVKKKKKRIERNNSKNCLSTIPPKKRTHLESK